MSITEELNMAQETLNNGEQYGSIRGKLNTMFGELYTLTTSLGASITSLLNSNTTLTTTVNDINTNITSINTLNANQNIHLETIDDKLVYLNNLITTEDTRITSLENTGLSQVALLTPINAVSITTTPNKLLYFDTISLQVGLLTTPNLTTHDIVIEETGIYRVSGNIICDYSLDNELSLRLYKNASPITPEFSSQGLGSGKPINISYSTLLSLTSGDILSIYAKSNTSTFSLNLNTSNVIIEKTNY
jgi:hypothetical protein